MEGKLSVVATPIGNLEDITLRALRVLKEADYILAEDTRVTGKLLKHYNIETKMKRYDAHTSDKAHTQILDDLNDGRHVALVSDAGTPGISDPGVLLVSRVRGEIPETIIETIPGPSALTAAFSIAGIAGNQFIFLGFAPQKKGRQTFFKELTKQLLPIVFYESSHRIHKTLEALAESSADRTIVIARELTKLHEEVISGTAEELQQYFEEHSDHVKGEFVVLISSHI